MTARNAIILGFVISCAALLVNAIVLSRVNNKLRDTETEYTALSASLVEQTNIKNEGEKKFENYRLHSTLAPLLPAKDRAGILYDAESLFHDSILYLYSAGNDLSMTEFRRVETEMELENARQEIQKTNGESSGNKIAEPPISAKKAENDSEEFERAYKILDVLKDESGKIDYKAKHQAISTAAELITESKDEEQKERRFSRINSLLSERYIESYDNKRRKIAELNDLRNEQSNLVSYCTFGSLILQMFGLAFIFLKDFIQDKRR